MQAATSGSGPRMDSPVMPSRAKPAWTSRSIELSNVRSMVAGRHTSKHGISISTSTGRIWTMLPGIVETPLYRSSPPLVVFQHRYALPLRRPPSQYGFNWWSSSANRLVYSFHQISNHPFFPSTLDISSSPLISILICISAHLPFGRQSSHDGQESKSAFQECVQKAAPCARS